MRLYLQRQASLMSLSAEAQAVAHKLAGNLGMFGYGAAGSIASEIEHLFKDPTPESFAHLATLARQLRRTLEPHL
jgi:HPt (histidine-containing phosphotransfer) domain-containing protein